MTKLTYIGRQEVPPGLGLDAFDLRLWNIEDTTDPRVTPFIHSTRSTHGLRELGIIPKSKLEVIA